MKTIQLLGRQIPIQLLNPLEFKNEAEKASVWEEDLQGWFDHETNKIVVNNALSTEQRRRVLVHELTHALFYTTGLSYVLNSRQEEAVCSCVENLLPLMNQTLFEELEK